jgi:hypothetical protein
MLDAYDKQDINAEGGMNEGGSIAKKPNVADASVANLMCAP